MDLTTQFKREPSGLPNTAGEMSTTTLVALSLASVVAAATLAALVYLAIRLQRTKTEHKAFLQDLEQRGLDLSRPVTMRSNPPLTVPHHVLRRSTFVPFGSQSGWDTLDSREDVTNVAQSSKELHAVEEKSQKRWSNTARFPWLSSKKPASQSTLTPDTAAAARLSAIIESPAILAPRSPGFVFDIPHEISTPAPQQANTLPSPPATFVTPEDLYCSSPFAPTVVTSPGTESLKPEPLTVKKNKKKRYRAQTVGSTIRPVLPSSEKKNPSNPRNIYSHSRSFSLGSQNPGLVPHGPVPPLPLSIAGVKSAEHPRSWAEPNASRLSVSSLESIGSSLLAASPRVQTSSNAWLKGGAERDCVNSLITGPRPLRRQPSVGNGPHHSPGNKLQSLQGSIRSNTDRFSVVSIDRDLPRDSSSHTIASSIQISPIGKIATAETVRLSRVLVISTTGNASSLVVHSTPRRQSRLFVTPNGSPAQRKTPKFRDGIQNQIIPTRELSQTSSRASSTRSSNGNPFQFDPSPMATAGRPSAMKGSPNSRHKGHKRQNCVRISVPTSTNKSPSPTMAGIQEESPEAIAKETESSNIDDRALPRPPSSATFAPDVKIHLTTLRASLTPSSPTLSMVPYAHDSSSREHSMSLLGTSPGTRDTTRHSKTPSAFTIPTFPSPGKTVLTTDVLPTPTFSFSRPSNEYDERSSPPAEFKLLAKPVAPDSPPLDLLTQTHVGSSPLLEGGLAFPVACEESEPATSGGAQASSPTPLPLFAPRPVDPWNDPPRYTEKLRPISPPCSPKSASPSLEVQLCMETLTPLLEECSAMEERMLMIPDHSPSPIPASARSEQASKAVKGPRNAPAKPLRSLATQLRRMNSEAERESATQGVKAMKTWRRLGGREPSPVLDQNASRSDSWVSLSAIMGTTGNRDSMASLSEIDRILEGSVEESDEVQDNKAQEGNTSLSDEESQILPGTNTISDLGSDTRRTPVLEVTTSRKRSNRESSVWEDGESFWERRPERIDEEEDDDNPLPLVTTLNTQNRGRVGKAFPQRISLIRRSAILDNPAILQKLEAAVSGMGLPEVRILPASSPGSMYDENGFLKS